MAGKRDEARYEERRNRILDAAAEVFRSRGYQGSRLEDIAELVGVTKASVYYYFPKKSDLLIEICARAIDQSLARQKRIMALDVPAGERLREAVADHLRGMAANVSLWSIFFRELELELADDPRRQAINRHLRQFGRRFQSLLEEGVEAGVFRALDARIASNAILGMLNWSHRWIQSEDTGEVVDTLLELIERGIART
jgi:TetR/AcrR family transcriptional regulator, cholesterol catabolism regulator